MAFPELYFYVSSNDFGLIQKLITGQGFGSTFNLFQLGVRTIIISFQRPFVDTKNINQAKIYCITLINSTYLELFVRENRMSARGEIHLTLCYLHCQDYLIA